MGFFSFNVAKAFTRAVGLPDKIAPILDVAFLPFGATHLAGSAISAAIGAAAPSKPMPPANQSVAYHYAINGQSPYAQPSYQTPFYSYGSDYSQPSYQPTDQFYGGSPWGSSTQYSPPSIMPYQTYSAPTPDRSWEDLILSAAPLFL
jgi:hypothetical protein